ncbi:MAG: sigma-70 family RNA polymerase sigma factor [Clostridiales bacterium]|nr:sigma-70 family RNA polymerase sigma factor [Clostridiales bacterium]
MSKSSSCDETTVRFQFDRMCRLAMKSEQIDYMREMDRLSKNEKLFSELSQEELSQLCAIDEYSFDSHCFQIYGCDIKIKNDSLANALQTLTEKKRNVILLSYFLDMSDAEIADEMSLVRCTVYEHRKRALELLKQNMEDIKK